MELKSLVVEASNLDKLKLNRSKFITYSDLKDLHIQQALKNRLKYLVAAYTDHLGYTDDNNLLGGLSVLKTESNTKTKSNDLICIFLVAKTHVDYVEIYYKRTLQHKVIMKNYDLHIIDT